MIVRHVSQFSNGFNLNINTQHILIRITIGGFAMDLWKDFVHGDDEDWDKEEEEEWTEEQAE